MSPIYEQIHITISGKTIKGEAHQLDQVILHVDQMIDPRDKLKKVLEEMADVFIAGPQE